MPSDSPLATLPIPASAPTSALFTPKLITILRESYSAADLRSDVLAGLTVAVVALPLSMAIAIASNAPPERGLYAAIIGGFFVSLLGGTRFQIGGPAGAFIVLVAACVERHGLDGMLLAVIMSGVILVAAGFLKLGTYIKFIPYPVTVGFTAGIATIIFASQIGEALGLAGREPAALLPKLQAIVQGLPHAQAGALFVAALTVGLIVLLGRLRPHWPNFLIALVVSSVAVAALGWQIDTIGTQFGGIAAALPSPSVHVAGFPGLLSLLPDAFAFALLGSIESLLSATVADGMTGRRHRSNCELVAQGVANVFSGLFGCLPVTGAIARTATNIRAGARGPIAGIAHSLFLLLFMLVAAPVARFIPLAALAGVLAMVAWNMFEKRAFATLLSASRSDAAVLLATFLLTIFRDVTTGIVIGFGASMLLFMARMSKTIGIEHVPLVAEDEPDNGARTRYDAALAADPMRVVFRLSGAFFFGTASTVASVLDRIAERPKTFILDFAAVPFLDSSAAVTIDAFSRKAARQGVTFVITGASAPVRDILAAHGLAQTGVRFERTIAEALAST